MLGAGNVLTSTPDRDCYDHDGYSALRRAPEVVVTCHSVDDVVAAVKTCCSEGVGFVGRGAGTGLSGGATPLFSEVVIGLAGMNEIEEVAVADRLIVAGPGVTNAEMTRAVGSWGMYYAPDPSSQVVCTIGGNVAENSGGAHCLKYGFTTNHVLGVEIVTPGGEVVLLGGDLAEVPGYDLRGVFIGSEGTLGIATKIYARVLVRPEAVATMLVEFNSVAAGAGAVADIVSSGIVPAALEMMDQLAMVACEEATEAGLPVASAAVLLIECDGEAGTVDEEIETIRALCEARGALSIRLATDESERRLLWRARKAAFAAMGRLAPDYIVQDGVVPRASLAEVLDHIAELAREAGLAVANVFHAGDGNLHPLVLFDDRQPGEGARARTLAEEILAGCVERGGSITGEHGVGIEKSCLLSLQFSPSDLEVMERVRAVFDPERRANTGKVFPTPQLCGEPTGRYRPHPVEEAGLGERW